MVARRVDGEVTESRKTKRGQMVKEQLMRWSHCNPPPRQWRPEDVPAAAAAALKVSQWQTPGVQERGLPWTGIPERRRCSARASESRPHQGTGLCLSHRPLAERPPEARSVQRSRGRGSANKGMGEEGEGEISLLTHVPLHWRMGSVCCH